MKYRIRNWIYTAMELAASFALVFGGAFLIALIGQMEEDHIIGEYRDQHGAGFVYALVICVVFWVCLFAGVVSLFG